jgi:hypothetical protein
MTVFNGRGERGLHLVFVEQDALILEQRGHLLAMQPQEDFWIAAVSGDAIDAVLLVVFAVTPELLQDGPAARDEAALEIQHVGRQDVLPVVRGLGHHGIGQVSLDHKLDRHSVAFPGLDPDDLLFRDDIRIARGAPTCLDINDTRRVEVLLGLSHDKHDELSGYELSLARIHGNCAPGAGTGFMRSARNPPARGASL